MSRIFVGNLPIDIRTREVEDIFYKVCHLDVDHDTDLCNNNILHSTVESMTLMSNNLGVHLLMRLLNLKIHEMLRKQFMDEMAMILTDRDYEWNYPVTRRDIPIDRDPIVVISSLISLGL